jgi:murein DD-endopeptidase MepM/ murein hydrolase activator NlpD
VLSRRAFLSGFLSASALGLAAACDGEEQPVRILSTAGPSGNGGAPLALATPPPPTPTPAPPRLLLPTEPVPQGGAFLVVLLSRETLWAEVELAGRRFRAIHEGESWPAFVATGQAVGSTEQLPPAEHAVRVHFGLSDGRGPQTLEGMVTVIPTEFATEALTLPPGVSALLDPVLVEQDAQLLRSAYAAVTPVRRWSGGFLRPSAAPVTDGYGTRRSYNGGPLSGSHAGVDFGGELGSPVTAAAAGVVVHAGPLPVRGNVVVLDHGAGVHTGYCHLAGYAVEVGLPVEAGQLLGSTGSTGLSTGPHLHWEVSVGGHQVDGARWLRPDQL